MKEKLIAGIDVGLKVSTICIMKDYSILSLSKIDSFDIPHEIGYAGIDAPLSLPHSGNFRECERKIQRAGIPLLPPVSGFMKTLTQKGIEMKNYLESKGIAVFEVYPYATRVILGIGKNVKKTTMAGRKVIMDSLSRFLHNPHVDIPSHDELDAILSALTVELFMEGKGEEIEGKDGKIIVPRM